MKNYTEEYMYTKEYKEAIKISKDKKMFLLNAKRKIKKSCNAILKCKDKNKIYKLYQNFQFVFFANTCFLRIISQDIPVKITDKSKTYIRIKDSYWADIQYEKLNKYQKKVEKYLKENAIFL